MTTEERLEIVEQELAVAKRRICWMLGGGALLILGCLTIAATPGNNRTIRANRFIVEDANGRARAMMSVDKDESALTMRDANGKLRVMMNVDKIGPGLVMLDANGKPIWTAP